MKTDLYNQKGEKAGTVELSDRIFAREWVPQLVHQALRAQVSNSREVVAHSKGRHEVRGGGKKPYAQKHTGRARHGSIRSPIFRGGGVAHGPVETQNFTRKINKKMRQAALFSVLSKKLADNEIRFVDSLAIEKSKTKAAFEFLAGFGQKKGAKGKSAKISALLVPAADNRSIYRAARNIPKVKSLSPKALNVYDLLKFKTIFIEKGAIKSIEETYNLSNTNETAK